MMKPFNKEVVILLYVYMIFGLYNQFS